MQQSTDISKQKQSDTISNKTSSVVGNSQISRVSEQYSSPATNKLKVVDELKFEEIILESNEIDLEEL